MYLSSFIIIGICQLLPSIISAQLVNVTVFVESQCPYCTKFMREKLWKFHRRHAGVMNLQFVPFGKGRCDYDTKGHFYCTCMHGPTECDLNRLQNCAMYQYPKKHVGLVTCIQGLANLREAFSKCVSRLSKRGQERLIECATGQKGEFLNYQSMLNTNRAGIHIWPTIYVNGYHFDHSTYSFEDEVCRHTSYC